MVHTKGSYRREEKNVAESKGETEIADHRTQAAGALVLVPNSRGKKGKLSLDRCD